jgi:hypothetical protein
MKYKLLIEMSLELKEELEKIAKAHHLSKGGFVRTLIAKEAQKHLRELSTVK